MATGRIPEGATRSSVDDYPRKTSPPRHQETRRVKRTLVARWLLACLISAGCNGPDAQPRVKENPKVRVGFSPLLSFGPIMIADAEGYFRDEGLDVELVPALSAQDETVGLVTGDLDVKLGPLHAIFFSAIARGANIRVVASQGYLARDGCTYFGIIRRHGADSSTTAVKRIRSSQDGVTRFVADRMLAQKNVDISSLETMRLPEALHAMSLENGSIDAIAASEPSLTRLKNVGFVWLSGQEAAPDLQWEWSHSASVYSNESATPASVFCARTPGHRAISEGTRPRATFHRCEGYR